MELQPPDATVGLLPQESERVPGETVSAFLNRRTGVGAAQARLDRATAALAAGTDSGTDSADEYSTALERWLALGGADLDVRIEQVAADLGLDIDTVKDCMTVDGTVAGQVARKELDATIEGLAVCAGSCPSAGVVTAGSRWPASLYESVSP